MSSFLRSIEKRAMKKAGFKRSRTGAIINPAGDAIGSRWPRLNWPIIIPRRERKKRRHA